MPSGVGALAYFLPSGGEFLVLLVLGVMLFGRRLPEVARAVGRTMGQLRRSYDSFKRELNADESLRDIRSSVQDVKRLADTPRRMRDPKHLFDALTDERRSTPVADGGRPAKASVDRPDPQVTDA